MKKFLLFILMTVMLMTANAQQTTVEGSHLFDNTSVSVYAGAMGWVNPDINNAGTFVDGVRPNFGVAVNKWFTPVIGAEISFESSVNSLPFNQEQKRWTAFDFMNLTASGQVNLNNLFHHYTGKPDRVEFVPTIGLGYGHGSTHIGSSVIAEDADRNCNFLTSTLGLPINFNLGNEMKWQFNVRPEITYVVAGEKLPVRFNAKRSYVELHAGLTYKFGHKNSVGTKTHSYTKGYTVEEYNELQRKYDRFKNKPPEVQVVERVQVVEKVVELKSENRFNVYPHFYMSDDQVDATSEAILMKMAEVINNSDAKTTYTVYGYASEDGPYDLNLKLSQRRAEIVMSYLIDFGVDAARIKAQGCGPTDQFGPEPEDNRVAVVEADHK